MELRISASAPLRTFIVGKFSQPSHGRRLGYGAQSHGSRVIDVARSRLPTSTRTAFALGSFRPSKPGVLHTGPSNVARSIHIIWSAKSSGLRSQLKSEAATARSTDHRMSADENMGRIMAPELPLSTSIGSPQRPLLGKGNRCPLSGSEQTSQIDPLRTFATHVTLVAKCALTIFLSPL